MWDDVKELLKILAVLIFLGAIGMGAVWLAEKLMGW